MVDTNELNLPLLSPNQAQKHVTVNEALSRLDGLVQLRLQSVATSIPPAVFSDGVCYGVPSGASGEWAGQAGNLALAVNGGWEFVTAKQGFRAYVLDIGSWAMFDGADWRIGAVSQTGFGAGINVLSSDLEVSLSAGSVTTPVAFPERAIAFGVTGRVIQAISGASTWRLGVAGDDQRYASGLGTSLNSWVSGPSTPLVYWSDTELLISAEGGNFTGGAVRLSVHYAMLELPRSV